MSSYVSQQSQKKACCRYEVTCEMEGLLKPEEEQLGAGISTLNRDGLALDSLERATWSAACEVRKLFRAGHSLKLYVCAGKILGRTREGCFLLKLHPLQPAA